MARLLSSPRGNGKDSVVPEPDTGRSKAQKVHRVWIALFPHLFAVALVMAGTGMRLGLDPVLGEHHAFTLYFAAVALAAWYGGFAPAMLATVLSYFAADWFFITPRFQFNMPHTSLDEFLALIAFLFSCLAIAITSQRMRGALRRTRQKQADLESEISRRKLTEQALREAQDKLQTHADELEDKVRERTRHLEQTIHSLEGVCYHIAHDLRAPLRAMHGFTGILDKDYANVLDEEAKRYLRHINKASVGMDELIHALLEYGRLGHQEFPLHEVATDFVLDRVLADLEPEVRRSGATIDRAEEMPHLRGNESLMEAVFFQLLSNSLKFVSPGTAPHIKIYTEQAAQVGHIRIVVEDQGIGISKEHLPRSFWIFEQLHPGGGYPGVGMGLAIAYKAVARMGGQIGVESDEGHGSRFWFELPMVGRAPKHEARHKAVLAMAE